MEDGFHLTLYDDLFEKYGTLYKIHNFPVSKFERAAKNPDGTFGINVNIYLSLLDTLRSIKKLVANTCTGCTGTRPRPYYIKLKSILHRFYDTKKIVEEVNTCG